ncbi:MAG: sulfite exporter TauE/SafE family protein [Dehalococcoidia bacterium]|nr:MAG: sulfite exporter TauE/SafE family protein [Dehalococcoidia bacterium]
MKIYIDVFILGLTLSWGPCLWFCAPIILPYISATQKGWRKGLKLSLTFSLARIGPYVILSSLAAGLSSYLINRFYQTQAGLTSYIIAAVFILLLGIFIVIGEKMPCKHVRGFIGKSPQGIREMALLGFLVGFAPCLPLLGVLAYIAFHAQGFAQGALLGLAFGAGTLLSPLILFGSLAGAISPVLLKKPIVYNIFSRLCGLILMYFGIGMIIKAWR